MQVSLQAKQLIYRLLHRDPKNRLGSREGANEIKGHPFFRGVNWALVRCMVIYNTLNYIFKMHASELVISELELEVSILRICYLSKFVLSLYRVKYIQNHDQCVHAEPSKAGGSNIGD